MSNPGPDPKVAPAMSGAALTEIVTAVQSDSPQVAPAILGRITASRESGSVCMMGGWTA
ncbi:hypothetical protein ABZ858_21825 [Streptomyces sp. NPDC047017]|uniref:hypothetical protein n=1 Tax=Streptomyces sp. NPDC047017 TaxID=3155024 RepID=UPI0033C35D35